MTDSLIKRRTFLRGIGAATLGVATVGAFASRAVAGEVSQNGWPAAPASELDLDPVWAAAFPGNVLAGDVSTVLGYVAARLHAEVEKVYIAGSWGHYYRKIAGSSDYSNHSSGTAFDLNAPSHPQHQSGTFTSDQVSAIKDILAVCGDVVRWGGDYTPDVLDEMHFEINVPPGDQRLTDLAKKLSAEDHQPPQQPTLVPESVTGTTASSPAVKVAQTKLNEKGSYGLEVNSSYDDASVTAAKDFQAKNGLDVDGYVGPLTWQKLVA